MGQQQSKGELLYQQVNYGNVEGIKALAREGAGLEWIDKEGKTPLIVACMNPGLYDVAKTLIELGANVNAYRPGRQGGTPLHHAVKRGLESTVKLLLSNGANALLINDDCQTPLEVARAKGYINVVRAIESHICLFSGWLREFYGPGFLEILARQLLSRNVWVVIYPTGSRNPTKPFRLELAIYPSLQDPQPRTVIALWKANLEEPKFHQSDPSVIIVDNSIKTRLRLAPANESDKQQLQRFCDACKGIPQVSPTFLHNSGTPVVQATAPPRPEDVELAMAINASIQSAIAETPNFDPHPTDGASSSTGWNISMNANTQNALITLVTPLPQKASGDQQAKQEASSGDSLSQQAHNQNNIMPVTQTLIHVPDANPSAPPADEIIWDGPIQYPTIDLGPVDISSPPVEELSASKSNKKEEKEAESSCVICLDAPVEGACVPCGHMAGCMSCLNEVKAKKWGCPVCRAKIKEVVRLYAV